MDPTSPDPWVRRLLAGDATAIEALADRVAISDDPATLVAAALVVPGWQAVLARAARAAESTRDRAAAAVRRT